MNEKKSSLVATTGWNLTREAQNSELVAKLKGVDMLGEPKACIPRDYIVLRTHKQGIPNMPPQHEKVEELQSF